ncbi:hypothetical protein WMY93_011768 [Mugilogobius chulae]|uniref:Uncharacterized protein n=1 Tax=Mugilogobius chulae TaxID=88201 RepID=A0AAW0P705_9GOBI
MCCRSGVVTPGSGRKVVVTCAAGSAGGIRPGLGIGSEVVGLMAAGRWSLPLGVVGAWDGDVVAYLGVGVAQRCRYLESFPRWEWRSGVAFTWDGAAVSLPGSGGSGVVKGTGSGRKHGVVTTVAGRCVNPCARSGRSGCRLRWEWAQRCRYLGLLGNRGVNCTRGSGRSSGCYRLEWAQQVSLPGLGAAAVWR